MAVSMKRDKSLEPFECEKLRSQEPHEAVPNVKELCRVMWNADEVQNVELTFCPFRKTLYPQTHAWDQALLAADYFAASKTEGKSIVKMKY